jgi:hypothetical protein
MEKKAPAKDAFFSKSRIKLPDQQPPLVGVIIGGMPAPVDSA